MSKEKRHCVMYELSFLYAHSVVAGGIKNKFTVRKIQLMGRVCPS